MMCIWLPTTTSRCAIVGVPFSDEQAIVGPPFDHPNSDKQPMVVVPSYCPFLG